MPVHAKGKTDTDRISSEHNRVLDYSECGHAAGDAVGYIIRKCGHAAGDAVGYIIRKCGHAVTQLAISLGNVGTW